MKLTLHIAFEDFTVLIFTIRFTGIAGIMILIFMIPTIILHGIIRHGHMPGTGAGDTTGIHLTIVGVGVILRITVTGTGLIILITAGDILTIHGMEAVGMPTRKITVTGRGDQPVPVYCAVTMVDAEHQLQQYVHRPVQQKVPGKGLRQVLQKLVAVQFQAQVSEKMEPLVRQPTAV